MTLSDPASYFDAEAWEQARDEAAGRSRVTVRWMTPAAFLSVAQAGKDDDKARRIDQLVRLHTAFNAIPFLYVDNQNDGTAQVVGHEGRHRAMALQGLGVPYMPVRIRCRDGRDPKTWESWTIRWSSPDGHIRPPEWLIPEQGASATRRIPFPQDLAVQPHQSVPASRAAERLPVRVFGSRKTAGDHMLGGPEHRYLHEAVRVLQYPPYSLNVGYGNPVAIGCGSFGCAFVLDDTPEWILKITADPSDAASWQAVLNAQASATTPRKAHTLARVTQVFAFPLVGLPHPGDASWAPPKPPREGAGSMQFYGIVMERLLRLTDRNEIDFLDTSQFRFSAAATYPQDRALLLGKAMRMGVATQKVETLLDTLSYLFSIGVDIEDVRGANVLQNAAGEWKIGDLGYAEVAEREVPYLPDGGVPLARGAVEPLGTAEHYHVTERETAGVILRDGFLPGWGDLGLGVYFYGSLGSAQKYMNAGGWDHELEDPVLLAIRDPRIQKIEEWELDPSWPKTKYTDMWWFKADDEDTPVRFAHVEIDPSIRPKGAQWKKPRKAPTSNVEKCPCAANQDPGLWMRTDHKEIHDLLDVIHDLLTRKSPRPKKGKTGPPVDFMAAARQQFQVLKAELDIHFQVEENTVFERMAREAHLSPEGRRELNRLRNEHGPLRKALARVEASPTLGGFEDFRQRLMVHGHNEEALLVPK